MAHNQYELLRQRRFLPFFVTQCFGAFNDNVYRQAMIGMLGFLGMTAAQKSTYATVAPAIFILPFFIFSATAGQIAEKLEKSRLIRITTTMEIVIMSVAAIGFVTGQLWLLLIALFATGVQSTLFGPVKYSILPSVLKPEELTGGNGLVEMGTSIFILTGMILGSAIFLGAEPGDGHSPWIAAGTIIVLAVAGNLVSRRIPPVEAAAPDLAIHWNPIPESLRILRMAKKVPAVRNAILGVSWFWFFGTVLTTQLVAYAEINLGGAPNSGVYILALALFSIGTGVGSLLCERLSARTVEIGLVPLGAFGMTAFVLHLYFARPAVSPTAGLDTLAFLQAAGSWRIVADLTLIGLFAGFFIVPLFALIQSRTAKTELSRVIAAMNIQNALFIVLAAGFCLGLEKGFGLTIPQVLLVLAIANAVVTLYIFALVPEFFMRFFSWVLTHVLYRAKVSGIEEYVPDEGAALVVCNHVAFTDPLVIMGAIPRPTRFVMYYKIFRTPGFSWMFRTARCIPIASAKEDEAVKEAAFAEVDKALAEGEIVGIFPEGRLTTDGEIAEFKAGVERILRTRPVPVVPMALKGMWASVLSKQSARWGRIPRRLRARIELVASPPVPGETATAASLEAIVRQLRGADA
jgi:1-acyl-sn-glycerol-3-phosphate acyltransferase